MVNTSRRSALVRLLDGQVSVAGGTNAGPWVKLPKGNGSVRVWARASAGSATVKLRFSIFPVDSKTSSGYDAATAYLETAGVAVGSTWTDISDAALDKPIAALQAFVSAMTVDPATVSVFASVEA